MLQLSPVIFLDLINRLASSVEVLDVSVLVESWWRLICIYLVHIAVFDARIMVLPCPAVTPLS